MHDTFGWIASILSLFGCYVNVKKSKWGFVLWGIADVIFVITSAKDKIWYLVFLYTIYTGIAAWGYWKWSKESKNV